MCAKENRPEICQLILNLLSDVAYITKLYKNDSNEQAKERSNHYLDLYLNTPEKGLSETPLHFAAKFGSVNVARLMLSNEMCNKMPTNKHGQTPRDIICSKLASAPRVLVEQMNSLFEESYYVPVYRDEERGDVVVERPVPSISVEKTADSMALATSPKLTLDLSNSSPLTSRRLSTNSSVLGPAAGLGFSTKKLAAFVGPVSTSAVSLGSQ